MDLIKKLLRILLVVALPSLVITQIGGGASNAGTLVDAVNTNDIRFCGQGQICILVDDVYYLVVKRVSGSTWKPVLYKSIDTGANWTFVIDIESTFRGSNTLYSNVAATYDASTNKLHVAWSGDETLFSNIKLRHAYYDISGGAVSAVTTFTPPTFTFRPPVAIATDGAGKVVIVGTSNSDPTIVFYSRYTGSTWSSVGTAVASQASGIAVGSLAYCSLDSKFHMLGARNSTSTEIRYFTYTYGTDTWAEITGASKPFNGIISQDVYGTPGRQYTVKVVNDIDGNLHAVLVESSGSVNTRVLYSSYNGTSWIAAEAFITASANNANVNASCGVSPDDKVWVAATAYTSTGNLEIYERTGVGSYTAQTITWTPVDFHGVDFALLGSVDVVDTPSITAPTAAATCISRNPTVTSSAFSGSGSHTESTWEISVNSDFSTTEWSAVSGSNLVSVVVNTTNGTFAGSLSGDTALDNGTTHYVRVKHKNASVYSSFSSAVIFTTLYTAANTPTVISPLASETGVSVNPSVELSAFSGNPGQTQATIAVQVFSDSGGSTRVWNGSVSTTSASLTVNSSNGTFENSLSGETLLALNTDYWVRGSYYDQCSVQTSWSALVAFITGASIVVTPDSFVDGTPVSLTSVSCTNTPIFMITCQGAPEGLGAYVGVPYVGEMYVGQEYSEGAVGRSLTLTSVPCTSV